MPTPSVWTSELEATLRQLWMEGQSATTVACALGHGISRNAVIGKAARLGLSGRERKTSYADPAKIEPRKAKRKLVKASEPNIVEVELIPEVDPIPELGGVNSSSIGFMQLTASNCHWPWLDDVLWA
jgi:GcrA cell cycle regulator